MIAEKGNINRKYISVAAVVAVVKNFLNTTYPNQKKEKQRKLENQNI